MIEVSVPQQLCHLEVGSEVSQYGDKEQPTTKNISITSEKYLFINEFISNPQVYD
jgi:hypothetical protein